MKDLIIDIELPDIGEDGTASPNQVAAVERILGMSGLDDFSCEQAQMVLGARDYAEKFIDENEGICAYESYDMSLRAATVMALNNETVLNYTYKWSRKNFNEGLDPEKLVQNAAYKELTNDLINFYNSVV